MTGVPARVRLDTAVQGIENLYPRRVLPRRKPNSNVMQQGELFCKQTAVQCGGNRRRELAHGGHGRPGHHAGAQPMVDAANNVLGISPKISSSAPSGWRPAKACAGSAEDFGLSQGLRPTAVPHRELPDGVLDYGGCVGGAARRSAPMTVHRVRCLGSAANTCAHIARH